MLYQPNAHLYNMNLKGIQFQRFLKIDVNKTARAIKNGHPRDTGGIGDTRHK